MKWKKLGRIFTAHGQREWMMSHASVPTPEHVGGDLFRVYFSPRDHKNRSHVGCLVIDITKPHDILEISETPSLSPGALGTFDESGAMCSWVCHHADQRILFYIGWNLGATVPWNTSIGLASCNLSGPPLFHRHADGPVLARSVLDPFFTAGPFVLIEDPIWRMWYLSGTGWGRSAKRMLPRYNLRYAESSNGIEWRTNGLPCIDHVHPGEVAIARRGIL